MLVYSSSLLEEDLSLSSLSRETEFDPVMDTVLHPALEMCERMGEMRNSEWDRSVFGINCWENCINALEGFEFTERRRKALEDQEEVFVDRLIGEHVSSFLSFALMVRRRRSANGFSCRRSKFSHLLAESGLEPILTALNTKDPNVRVIRFSAAATAIDKDHVQQTPLSHLPTASSHSLSLSLTNFGTFLSTTDTLTSPRLSLLPPVFARVIHSKSLGRVSGAYDTIWQAVMEECNRFEGRSTLLRRSREEVRVLLGVEEELS